MRLASRVTVAQLLQREDYATRYASSTPISLHEFLYPLAQGFDSVHVKADLEIGGTDQTFNLLLGRELQRAYGQRPQVVMTMPLLEGLDGVEKMSKSLGNHIGVSEPPFEIFGKVMSISDRLMQRYYEMLTDFDYAKITQEIPHPRDRKVKLAREMVKRFHGEESAAAAQKNFEVTYAKKGVPDDARWIKAIKLCAGEHMLAQIIKESGLAPSSSEARRLLKQGAVELDGVKIRDERANVTVKTGDVPRMLKVGKKGFLKIEFL